MSSSKDHCVMIFLKYKRCLTLIMIGFVLIFGIKSVSAHDDLSLEETRIYLLENHGYSEDFDSERDYIQQCFKDENPFEYCLVLLDLKWQFVDKNLQQPYDVYMFDNGPDYSSEGYYRIRKNGKIGFADAITGKIVIAPIYECAHPFRNGRAKVGLKCQTIREGEHSYWEAGEWFLLDRPEQ